MADSKRTRNYATVIYADSAPANWREIIESWHVPCFVSPYHDHDINPNGEPKKPHWHVQLLFDNVKTAQQAIDLFDQINGVGCEVINSARAYARYLCHLDNPDKYRYSPSDVIQLGGADYFSVIESCSDQIAAISMIEDICEDRCIYTYSELCRVLRREYPELYRVMVLGFTVHMTNFVKSLHYEHKLEADRRFEYENRE